MSIGNLKTEGNKGNNFPWQLKMLQGLQALIDSGCCDEILPLLQPQVRTPFVLVSTDETNDIGGGAYSISIANIGTAAGLVNGVSIPAGTILNFDAGVLNNTLSQITYNSGGTTFLITGLTSPAAV
jgi:hypothetical protein